MTEEIFMPMDNAAFNKMAHHNRLSRGMASEMIVAADLYERGYRVSKPLDNDQGYDFILDRDGVLDRVQVKTLSQNGSQAPIGFTKYFWNGVETQTRQIPKYREGVFDILAVVDRHTKVVYYIPASEIDFSKANVKLNAEVKESHRDI